MAELMPRILDQARRWLLFVRQRVSKQTQRRLELALNGLLLALVALIIYQHSELLPILGQSLSLTTLVVCLLAYGLSLVVQAAVWIDLMGYRPGTRRIGLEDYVQTTLMGRLPGGLWKWFGRVTFYRASHLSTKAILSINLVELFLLLITALVLLTLLIPMAWLWQLVLLSIQVLVVVAVLWSLRTLVPGLQSRWLPLRVLLWGGGYALAWLCGAVILYLLVAPFSQMPINLLDALRLACISGVVNIIFQILPVSLLFRDLTLLALLGAFMGPPQALVAIFALRLVSSVCELLTSWMLIAAVRILPFRPKPRAVTAEQVVHQQHPG